MIPIAELRKQHDELNEMAQVLFVLISNESTRSAGITHKLFLQLAEMVKKHFELEDRTLYTELVNHKNKEIKGIAWQFISGTPVLKKYFSRYVHHWCNWEETGNDCTAFIKETGDVFSLLKDRIKIENEKLYPLVEKLQS